MDPLKPFANLMRSLWTGKTRSSARAVDGGRPTPTGQQPQAKGIAPAAQVSAKLQSRLALLREWNSARARELFVEHVLLVEFGSDIARDPVFADLVRRVSTQLEAEPALGARLDHLLQQLAADRHAP